MLAASSSLDAFAAGAFSIVNPGTLYKWNWHIGCIAEHLQAVYDDQIATLIINMPPRELKSFLVSTCLPAWGMGKRPHMKFIVASHSLRPLAEKLSEDTERLMSSGFYKEIFPEVEIVKNTSTMITTSQNGHRLAMGVTGVTGLGGDILVLDDPNKPDEALSDVIRIGTNSWIDNTYISRADDQTKRKLILVQQRVHENDVTGHFLDKGGAVHLKLPAENISGNVISYSVRGRTFPMLPGELLHEDRLPKDVLITLEKNMGAYNYAGQYLQEPVPVGGGMFKKIWVKYFDPVDLKIGECTVFILCDPAGVGEVAGATKRRKKSDWTAFMVVALAPDNNYYLLDIVRDKFNPTERINALFELHRHWSAQTGKPAKVGYESYGLQSDLHYIEEKQKTDSYRFPLIPLGGSMSKPDRIARLIPDMQNGRWYFPHKVVYKDTRNLTFDLVQEMIDGEMLTFPVSKHDDCLDALSRIYDEDLEAKMPRLKKKQLSEANEIGAVVKQQHWTSL